MADLPDFEFVPEMSGGDRVTVIDWRGFREAMAQAQLVPMSERRIRYLIQNEGNQMRVNRLLGKDGE